MLWKPALAVRVQDQTTEVEERAMIDLGILASAKKVFLYQQPLPALLDAAPGIHGLRDGIVFHIEPQG